MVELCRTLLFVPGNRYRMIFKVPELRNADMIVYDLEDAVSIDDKETARIFVRKALNGTGPSAGPEKSPEIVRINGLETGLVDEDLEHVVLENLYGIVLPKCESEESINELDGRWKVRGVRG